MNAGAFPWCSCVDYSPSSSPYSLSLVSTVATTDNVTAVFRVNALPLSPSPSICYQTLLNNGIEKIEVASQLACLRNVRVLIDGLPSSASGVALPANYRTVANIKVKFSSLVRSSGTTITIIGPAGTLAAPAVR
ncbi:pherophorin [Haematococcus lacustris]|uniref:Pherophorin n=1 Tax=Haematococcus lacustris TaxID=44745 RepID=A0A699ZNU5_HAELA|nr:pherophorin [Haematococcus lacustris]